MVPAIVGTPVHFAGPCGDGKVWHPDCGARGVLQVKAPSAGRPERSEAEQREELPQTGRQVPGTGNLIDVTDMRRDVLLPSSFAGAERRQFQREGTKKANKTRRDRTSAHGGDSSHDFGLACHPCSLTSRQSPMP
jgi:hypothetical protein